MFSIRSYEVDGKGFIKVVDMVAIPHEGSLVDVGDREPKGNDFDIVFRIVENFIYYPTGIDIKLKETATDTTDFLERNGWKYTVGGDNENKAMGFLGDEMLPKGWPHPFG